MLKDLLKAISHLCPAFVCLTAAAPSIVYVQYELFLLYLQSTMVPCNVSKEMICEAHMFTGGVMRACERPIGVSKQCHIET